MAHPSDIKKQDLIRYGNRKKNLMNAIHDAYASSVQSGMVLLLAGFEN